MFLHFAAGLVWAGFVERALEGFLDASEYVAFRLLKARTEGCFSCR